MCYVKLMLHLTNIFNFATLPEGENKYRMKLFLKGLK